jgi:hypothetical protein
MSDQPIVILGIPIPSSSPIFLAVLLVHVIAGLVAVVAGATAMLSRKRVGRHPVAGAVYYWSLAWVAGSMAILSVMRWPENNHLLALGVLCFVAASIGRSARRSAWPRWVEWHIWGMGLSYILMLTAFYVDNGPHLPLWNRLPPSTHWYLSSVIGLPVLLYVVKRHPLAQKSRAPGSH